MLKRPNLLKHEDTLAGILDTFIDSLQQENILPKELSNDQKDAIKENVLEIMQGMHEKGITLTKETLTNKPEVFNLISLMLTSEYFKTNGFKLLFPEKLIKELELTNDDKGLVNKLVLALDKLKNAKGKDDADSAFDEVMKLCNELTNKLGNDSSLMPQLEMTRMMATEMKNKHHEDEIDEEYEHTKSVGVQADLDDFTLSLIAIYGCDPHGKSATTCGVAGYVANYQNFGANISQGRENDRSLVAEENRLDGNKDEPWMRAAYDAMGKARETTLDDLVIVPPPSLTRE